MPFETIHSMLLGLGDLLHRYYAGIKFTQQPTITPSHVPLQPDTTKNGMTQTYSGEIQMHITRQREKPDNVFRQLYGEVKTEVQ